jgi:hypothetical protein
VGTSLAIAAEMNDDSALLPSAAAPTGTPVVERDPSIFLVSLHMIMWTNLVCGLVMVLVVVMLNW